MFDFTNFSINKPLILQFRSKEHSAMTTTNSIETWRLYAAIFFVEAEKRYLSETEIKTALDYAYRLHSNNLPIIFDIEHFGKLVGYKKEYIEKSLKRTRNFYRIFSINKKSGAKRSISEPLPSLKEIQRWILDNILHKISPHPASKAYKKGGSIRSNAQFHKSQNYVLCIDIKDFFPTIQEKMINNIFYSIGYSANVSEILSHLCCLNGSLPQGSPTSPVLSNLVCYQLDVMLFDFARKRNLRYTRYADDLCFSGEKVSREIIHQIYSMIQTEGFEPNLDKTRVMRRHQRQQVTGVIVNTKLNASRESRRQTRQVAYYIAKYGIENHSLKIGANKLNYRRHIHGKAIHILNMNKEDRDAKNLLDVMSKEIK